jgi:hypothetical protein
MNNNKENKEKLQITQEDLSKKEIKPPTEIGGAKGLEPTRYGDWEHNGRVSDF